jgi:imidazolonepropionase-like amidohydrolase
MYRAGVPILAGTDCHEEPDSFFEVKHGESLHQELELLVEAGVSVVDALRAATILPAEHFRLNDRGAIAEGKRADLVLLREDPTKDIRATRSIDRVWCGGIEYQSVT